MMYIYLIFEHIQITIFALLLSLILSIIIVYIGQKNKKIKSFFQILVSIAYAIPSLSMFSILIYIFGLGKENVIISLSIYALYILVRSFFSILDNFDNKLMLAANAMGLDKKTIFFKVQLPLIKDGIIANIKIAVSAIIAIANVGEIVNAGGIGKLIFTGLRRMDANMIFVAIILNALVYLIFSIFITKLINLMIKCISKA